MIIKDDFSHKIIISAVGEIQIKLLYLIYKNIYNITKKKYSTIIEAEENGTLNRIIKELLKEDIRPELLIAHGSRNDNMNKGTIYTRKLLEKYYKDKNTNIKNDKFLSKFNSIYGLDNYKLVNMKQFIQLYGKYLFNNDKDSRDLFVNNHPELSNCLVMKTIKEIPF